MTDPRLPDWYNFNTDPGSVGLPAATAKMAGTYVRKALGKFSEALAREICAPPCSKSWLGILQPRAKIVGFFLLIVAATMVNSLHILAILLIGILLTAASIRLPAKSLARVWAGVPLFSLVVILPAVTNLVTPGRSVIHLFSFGQQTQIWLWTIPQNVCITDFGLIIAGRFMLRSISCITLCYLLVASTEASALLNGLRSLGMPRVFGMVLTMAYRYIAAALQATEEIHFAKLSRTISAGTIQAERRWAATGIGMLFRRTYRLADQVHNAMIARGYDGDFKMLSRQQLTRKDLAWTAGMVLGAALLIALDRGAAGSLL